MPTLPYTPGPTPPAVMRSIMAQYHRDMQALVDHTLNDLAGRWQGVQANLANTIHQFEQRMAAAERAGQQIDATWLSQERRLLDLKAQVAGDVARYAQGARSIIGDAQLAAVTSGARSAQEAMQAAMSGVGGQPIGHTFNVVPADVLHQIAGATQPYSPLSRLFDEFGADASAAAQQALFQSVALGEGARVAAQRLVYATNMSASRAEVIARTEIMRSWRGAQFANYRANSDVVQAWQWAADFGPRCCFPAGTLVQTRRGLIPIEQVRVGDEALTHTGRYRRVTELLQRTYDGALVMLASGARQVTATPEHPFLVVRHGGLDWIGAGSLLYGDAVIRVNERGGHVPELLTHIASIFNGLPQTVYNLEVEDDHSYVANGFVVHNCGACMAMDGSIHPLTELLDDHICGRCSALPLTASYSDLLAGTGANADALAAADELEGAAFPVHESGDAWLNRQAPSMQNRILGPAKAEAFRRGDIRLADLVGVRHDPVWGSSIEERSLRSLGLDAQKYLALARGNGAASSLVDEAGLARAAAGTPQHALSEWERQRAAMIAQAEAAGRAAGQAGQATAAADVARMSEWELQRQQMIDLAEGRAPHEVTTAAEATQADTIGSAAISTSADALRADSERLANIFETQNVTDGAAAETKAVVSHALGQALRDNSAWQTLIGALGERDSEAAASRLIEQWALGNSPIAEQRALYVAIQRAIQDEFGLTRAEMGGFTADDLALADRYAGASQDGLRAFVREMYNQTQAQFADQGITEVTLYRGMSWDPGKQPPGWSYDDSAQVGRLLLQPASSFSTDAVMAYDFGGGDLIYAERYQSLVASRVAVRDILSTPLAGFGARAEAEMVVLGQPMDALVFSGHLMPGDEAFMNGGRVYQELAQAAENAVAEGRAPAEGKPE